MSRRRSDRSGDRTNPRARTERSGSPRAGGSLALVTLGLAIAFGAGDPARAQPAAPEDWPCVQRFVPEISAATLWPEPFDPALVGTWSDDADIAVLVRDLGELERVDDAALGRIDAFAESVPEGRRRAALTRVADGVVDVADERRALFLDGIRRYTRQQIAIASQIETTLNRLADLDDAEPGTVDAAGRAEVEETLVWHERLYDQRERAIRSLCDRPVALEETLSEVLRELSYRLPDA